jgi:hypothetical protein
VLHRPVELAGLCEQLGRVAIDLPIECRATADRYRVIWSGLYGYSLALIGDHVATGSITFADGIITSVHGQAAFDAALSGLTFADDSEKALLLYGIVIQNDGPSTVVAYCLQWVFDDGDGAPIIDERNYTQPFALDDGDKSGPLRFDGDMVLDPGGSCLITPADSYHLKPPSSEVSPSARWQAAGSTTRAGCVGREQRQKAVFASEVSCLRA